MDTLALALLTGIDHKNFVLMYEDLNLHEANKEWDLEEKKVRILQLCALFSINLISKISINFTRVVMTVRGLVIDLI